MNKSKSMANRPSGNGVDTDDSLEDCAQPLKDLINFEKLPQKRICTNEINPPKLRPSIVQRAFKKNVFVSSTPMFVKGRQHYFSSDSSFNISPIKDEEDEKKDNQNILHEKKLTNDSKKKQEKTEIIIISSDLSSSTPENIKENLINHKKHTNNNTILSNGHGNTTNISPNKNVQNDKTLTASLKDPKSNSNKANHIEGNVSRSQHFENKQNESRNNQGPSKSTDNETSRDDSQEIYHVTNSRSKNISAITRSLNNKSTVKGMQNTKSVNSDSQETTHVATSRIKSTSEDRISVDSSSRSRPKNQTLKNNSQEMSSPSKNTLPSRISTITHSVHSNTPDNGMRNSKIVNNASQEIAHVTKSRTNSTSPGQISATTLSMTNKNPSRSRRNSHILNNNSQQMDLLPENVMHSVNSAPEETPRATKSRVKSASPGQISTIIQSINNKSHSRSRQNSQNSNVNSHERDPFSESRLKNIASGRISTVPHSVNKSSDRSTRNSKSVNSDPQEITHVTNSRPNSTSPGRISIVTRSVRSKSPMRSRQRSQTLNTTQSTSLSRLSTVPHSVNKSSDRSTRNSKYVNSDSQEVIHVTNSRPKSTSPGRFSIVTRSIHSKRPMRSRQKNQTLNTPQSTSPSRISTITHSVNNKSVDKSRSSSKFLNYDSHKTGQSRLERASPNRVSTRIQNINNKSPGINEQNNQITNSPQSNLKNICETISYVKSTSPDRKSQNINCPHNKSVRNNVPSALDSPENKNCNTRSSISGNLNITKSLLKTFHEHISVSKNKEGSATIEVQTNITKGNGNDTVLNVNEGDLIKDGDIQKPAAKSSDLFQNITLGRHSENESRALQPRRKSLESDSEDLFSVPQVHLSKRQSRSEKRSCIRNHDAEKTSRIPILRSRSKSVEKSKIIKILSNDIISKEQTKQTTLELQVVSTLKELCDKGEELINQSKSNSPKDGVNSEVANITQPNSFKICNSSSKENINYGKRPIPKPRMRRTTKLYVSSTDDSDKTDAENIYKDRRSKKRNNTPTISDYDRCPEITQLNMSTQVGRSLKENVESRKNSAPFDRSRSIVSTNTSMTPNNKLPSDDVLNSTVKFIDNSRNNLEARRNEKRISDVADKQKRLSDFINRIGEKDFQNKKIINNIEHFRTPNRKTDNKFFQISCRSLPSRKCARLTKSIPKLVERQTQTSYKVPHKHISDSSDSSISNCTKFIEDCAADDVNLFDSLEPGSIIERFSSSLYDFNIVEHTEMPWRVDDHIKLPSNSSTRLSYLQPYQMSSHSFSERTKSPIKRKLRQYPNKFIKQSKLITTRRRSSSKSSTDDVGVDSDQSEIIDDKVSVVENTFVNDVGSPLRTAADLKRSLVVNNVEILTQFDNNKDTESVPENDCLTNINNNFSKYPTQNRSFRALSEIKNGNRTETEAHSDLYNEHSKNAHGRLTNEDVEILTYSNIKIRDKLEDEDDKETHQISDIERNKNVDERLNVNSAEVLTYNEINKCVDERLTNQSNTEILTYSNKNKVRASYSNKNEDTTRRLEEAVHMEPYKNNGKQSAYITDQSPSGNIEVSKHSYKTKSSETERPEMQTCRVINIKSKSNKERRSEVETRISTDSEPPCMNVDEPLTSTSNVNNCTPNKKTAIRPLPAKKTISTKTLSEAEEGVETESYKDTGNMKSAYIGDQSLRGNIVEILKHSHKTKGAVSLGRSEIETCSYTDIEPGDKRERCFNMETQNVTNDEVSSSTSHSKSSKHTKRTANKSLVLNIPKINATENSETEEVHIDERRFPLLNVILNKIDLNKVRIDHEKKLENISKKRESKFTCNTPDKRIDYERFKDLATRLEDSQSETAHLKPPPKRNSRLRKTQNGKTSSATTVNETNVYLEDESEHNTINKGIRRSRREKRPPISKYCPILVIKQATKADARYVNLNSQSLKCTDCDYRLEIYPQSSKKGDITKSRLTNDHETSKNVNNAEENKRILKIRRNTKSKVSIQEVEVLTVDPKVNINVNTDNNKTAAESDDNVLTSAPQFSVNNSAVSKRGRSRKPHQQCNVVEVPEAICTSSELNVNVSNAFVHENSSLKKSEKHQEVGNGQMIQEVDSQAEANENGIFLKPEIFKRPSTDSGRSTLLKSSFDEHSRPLRTRSRNSKKLSERNSKKLKRTESTDKDGEKNNITVSEYVEISSDCGTNSLKFIQKDPVFTKMCDNLSYSDSLDYSNGGSMMFLEIPPGEAKKRHTSKKHKLFYFVNEGFGRVYIGDTVSTIEKRGRFVVPTGLPYSIVNDSPTESLLLGCVRVPI